MPVLIPFKGAQAITGCSRSTIERLVDAGVFPEPVRVTFGRLGFVREEVEAWALDRIRARDERRDPQDDAVVRATAGHRHGARKPDDDEGRASRQERKTSSQSRVTRPSEAQGPAARQRGG